jgi:hypothetical protein
VTTKWRRRRLDRRGRPRKANARRRATTVAGRAPPPDYGTPELRQRKVRATTRDNLEVSAVGALLGRELIDIEQYNMLTTLTLWLERLMRSWGGTGGVTGLWHSIIGAGSIGYVRLQNDVTSGLADGARRQLVRALNQLDGSRSLVIALVEGQIPPLILRVLDGKITSADMVALERLRVALDHLAGRRTRQARNSASC